MFETNPKDLFIDNAFMIHHSLYVFLEVLRGEKKYMDMVTNYYESGIDVEDYAMSFISPEFHTLKRIAIMKANEVVVVVYSDMDAHMHMNAHTHTHTHTDTDTYTDEHTRANPIDENFTYYRFKEINSAGREFLTRHDERNTGVAFGVTSDVFNNCNYIGMPAFGVTNAMNTLINAEPDTNLVVLCYICYNRRMLDALVSFGNTYIHVDY